jgi:hypothetical protein
VPSGGAVGGSEVDDEYLYMVQECADAPIFATTKFILFWPNGFPTPETVCQCRFVVADGPRQPVSSVIDPRDPEMSLRISISLLSIVLAGAFFAAQARADADNWTACTATPGRACVLDRALDISRAMSMDGWRVDALISIAAAQAAAHRRSETASVTQDAVRVLNAVGSDSRSRANALGRIAAAQSRAGLTAEAAATIGDALQIIRPLGNVTGAEFTDFDLASMAGDQAEAGNFSAAMRVVQAITSEQIRAGAIVAVARGQARAGDVTEALRTVRPVATLDAAAALKYIGDAQMQAGLRREAATTSAEASLSVARWQVLLPSTSVELLVSMAESQAKAGLVQDARDTSIARCRWRNRTF